MGLTYWGKGGRQAMGLTYWPIGKASRPRA
jgi:hypothetical protein